MSRTLPVVRLLTAGQFARAIGLSRPTVVRLCREGEIRSQVLPGLGTRIRLEDALAYVRRARMVCGELERMAADAGLSPRWRPQVHFVSCDPLVIRDLALVLADTEISPLYSNGTIHAGMTFAIHRPDAVVVDHTCHWHLGEIVELTRGLTPRPLVGCIAPESGRLTSIPRVDFEWQHPVAWGKVAADVVARLRRGRS